MPSASLTHWLSDRMPRLDGIDSQVTACLATIPVNPELADENIRGFILLLSAHFQGYCRDLYAECAQILCFRVRPTLRTIVQEQFASNLSLDRGNPNLENIKNDFNRFGFSLDMSAVDPANHARLAELKQLNQWRNIVAHYGTLPSGGLTPLSTIQGWRSSCDGLAASLDGIMYNEMKVILRQRPWTA